MADQAAASPAVRRWHLDVQGVVQGVGFRPFIRQLAAQFELDGWVANGGSSAVIEIQGEANRLTQFIRALYDSLPARARIDHINSTEQAATTTSPGFEIKSSLPGETHLITLPPDLAPCPDCLREFHDPHSRRYHYPFISCTACGPRWSLLRKLPYDREQTSFADFPTCADCSSEYNDINQRRCHHQAISCPQCGPQLYLTNNRGEKLAAGSAALKAVTECLRDGGIVALKSVGGFQLLVDANNPQAIAHLRRRKRRPAKPLAVMFANMDQLHNYCHADNLEQQALQSSTRPIVLLQSKHRLPEEIAPDMATIGAMLPPSALHEALFTEWQTPLVATSGNLSGEPLCFENHDALETLGAIADLFLLNDLTITRPLDDSLLRVINQQQLTLRAGRGLAPLQLPLTNATDRSLLAAGGHQKNTIAITSPRGIIASPHIGDLSSTQSLRRLADTIESYRDFAGKGFETVITDLHPDYGSSHRAADSGYPVTSVQHHIAHFFSAMAEHNYRGPALGICWDGSGLGDDGMLWGGEFFTWDGDGRVKRVAHLRPFALPGGEAAIREPRRQALGLLVQSGLPAPKHLRNRFSDSEWHNLNLMLEKQINSPLCTSAGRVIDAVAALLQISYHNRFEADSAMQLEALAYRAAPCDQVLPFTIKSGNPMLIDWQPLVGQLLQQSDNHPAMLAAAFHNTLAHIIAAVAAKFDKLPVFLSGGVFQNRYLTEAATVLLRNNKHQVFTQRQVPPNDGGLAVGQLYYTMRMSACKKMDNDLCV